jgi:Tfp pilus assembly protein PilO
MDLLELDNQIRSLEKKEVIYLYIMVVGVSFFLSYYFLFESSEKSLEIAEKEYKKVSREIRDHKDYLMFHDEFEINKVRKDTENLKRELDEYSGKKSYLETQISKMESVIYDKRSWTIFLDEISEEAKSVGVEIISIANEFIEAEDIFANNLDVKLEVEGDYISTIIFIDKLERNSLIVDVEEIDMELGEESVSTKIALSVWGING